MNYLLIIIFGLIVGSFFNVCIYRIPLKKSIIFPERSYCPKCEHFLSALDNIPIFSYIFLKGKCRYCKKSISPRYIIVEVLTAILFALLLHKISRIQEEPRYIILYLLEMCIFVGFLIVISFIDLEHLIIPDKLVYPGIFIGLFFAGFRWILERDTPLLISRVIGAIAGAGIITIIAIIGRAVFRKSAMGIGDIKLMAMIGAYVGAWPYIPLILIIGAFIGSIFGLVLIILRRKRMDSYIPFGPFLSISAVISLFYGKEIWLWYKLLVGL